MAGRFARHVLGLDLSEGAVVGVLGPWGAGKTSFIHLTRAGFREAGAPMLDYNPWLFSGTEQLVGSFFGELAAQLRLRPEYSEIGNKLESYGEGFSALIWLPVLGPWLARGSTVAKFVAGVLKRRKNGLEARRKQLVDRLAKLPSPIVVVVDDIDRLTAPEIREVFKLVRLTASFPNIAYVVAFDRTRVEAALAEEGVPGRAYLEKILQLSVDIPPVGDEVLNQQLLAGIEASLEGIEEPGRFDEDAWPDVFMEIVRPLVRNMRDVRRYAVAIRGTVQDLEGQIALVDVLALEAIRIFLPEVAARLWSAADALTTAANFIGASPNQDAGHKLEIERLVASGGAQSDVVRALIQRLFPAAERHLGGSHFGAEWYKHWIRAHRVAHAMFLRLYLERVAGPNIAAFADAERAWNLFRTPEELDRFLRAMAPERLQDIIANLEAYEDRFESQHAASAITVLLNLLPGIPRRSRGMMGLDTALVVTRVTYRLLKTFKDPSATEQAVREILPRLATLSSQLELLNQVGHREGIGHRLISEDAAAELEHAWRMRVRSASAEVLAAERSSLRVILTAMREADPSEGALEIPDTPQLTLSVLIGAMSPVYSQPLESRAVREDHRLAWQSLVELYGGEDRLRDRIFELHRSGVGGGDALDLALRYAEGWRPRRDYDE